MRQRRGDLRRMTVKKPKDGEGLKYGWLDDGWVKIEASIQPFGPAASGGPMQVIAQQYGENISKMLMVFYAGPHRLEERDGICIDVPRDQPCDYRVVSVMRWPNYQQGVLDWIPEGRRK